MLIDKSYFVGERAIPRLENDSVEERLNWFIAKYEPEVLQKMLGYTLYSDFTAGLTANTQIYLDLRDGKAYTDAIGRPRKWQGLRVVSGQTKTSLIADYVYWKWKTDEYTQSTGLGETKGKSENAASVSPADKMRSAWNSLSNWAADLRDFLNANTTVYADWTPQYYRGFLTEFSPINRFGI